MKIEHIALWTNRLEVLKEFYIEYFQASAGEKYINSDKGFESYFLSFESSARLELMQRAGINDQPAAPESTKTGFIHIAVSVGSERKVRELTEQLRRDGYEVAGEPRTTGDGYFESIILDPDGNRIEITI